MESLRFYYIAVLMTIIALLLIPAPISPTGTYPKDRLICRVPVKEKVVAITFDDGPYPKYTEQILDILDKYEIKATFFMIGQRVEEYPDIAREVQARGHLIGNHSYTHSRDMSELSEEEILKEMKPCEEAIVRITGQNPIFYRSPSGNTNSIILKAAQEQGYYTVNWSIAADYHLAKTPQQMADRVIQNIQPGNIILVHDGRFPERWKDVEATPLIIQGLMEKGYRFVNLPELLQMSQNEASFMVKH
ncbi:MAG TPA: polysaccharide deacetylase family protein [Syntrophomonadaceae bacterium]|nr:polysaccharide deacetylase family protein [Syntrophomonadaceae bacterium]